MNDFRTPLRTAFLGCSLVAAVGAVTALIGAVQHRYAMCSIALFALAAGALGAYMISRRKDAATDRAVLRRLRTSPGEPAGALAAELGLRPAAVRLSIQRLADAGQIEQNTDHR